MLVILQLVYLALEWFSKEVDKIIKNKLSSLKIHNSLFFSFLSWCECSRVQLNS